ncbi:unnamed protein product [Nezara viridula]|uniref:Globin domain-containing protein n=1 Tax=Nezara viridula TaxID=85310 RepID=A0A9P0E7X2_NEZVI|nr:unnamed protein product [Nezara viridula]
MSLVQELVKEKYATTNPQKTDSFESLGANQFLYALEVPSDTSICNLPIEEARPSETETSEPSYKSLCWRYSRDLLDELFLDELNSVLFLSLEDIDNIRKKWRKIKNDPQTFGTLLMITLLNDAPETAAKMPANPGVLYNGVMVYDGITLRSGKEKAQLLNKIIKYIHLPEYVTSITHNSGILLSFNKTKLDKNDFEALHSAIIKTVTTYYKMDNTPEIIASLKKAMWIILGLIEDASHWNDFGHR